MQEPQRINVPSITSGRTLGRVRLSMRNYFSTNLAATSVIASATFLEAAVSELFQDAHDGNGLRGDGYLAPVESKAIAAMAKVWRDTDGGRDLDAVEKWQRLLGCCGLERLCAGAAPVQDAALVIDLRNALVHFKPEDVAADEEHKLEKRLRRKFPDNRLMEGSGNPWWPSHGLAHGCCEWAARSARALADRVLDDIGIIPNYRRAEAAGWNGREP